MGGRGAAAKNAEGLPDWKRGGRKEKAPFVFEKEKSGRPHRTKEVLTTYLSESGKEGEGDAHFLHFQEKRKKGVAGDSQRREGKRIS